MIQYVYKNDKNKNMSEEKPKFIDKDPISYKTESEQINSNREDLWAQIESERDSVKQKFAGLIEFVNERYKSSNSVIADSPQQLETFKLHNEQVLRRAIEQGIRRSLDAKTLGRLEIAAILHDLTKGDKNPEWAGDIGNFMLVYHGEATAKELEENEQLNQLLRDCLGEEDFEESLGVIQSAIRSHMGPHPGFMETMLEMVNKELAERGLDLIEHPYPEEGNVVAEILLAADMYLLASHKGIEKVIFIRANIPLLQQQDLEVSEQYEKQGVVLDPAEAAVLNAFDNAYAARDMVRSEEDRKWIQGAIDKAVEIRYRYEVVGEDGKRTARVVSIAEAQQKRKDYENIKRQQEALS